MIRKLVELMNSPVRFCGGPLGAGVGYKEVREGGKRWS